MDLGFGVCILLVCIFGGTVGALVRISEQAEKERKKLGEVSYTTREKHSIATRIAVVALGAILITIYIMILSNTGTIFGSKVETTVEAAGPVETTEDVIPETTYEITEPTEEVTEAPTEPETEPPTEEVTEPVKKYYNVPLSEDLQDHIFAECEKRNVDPALVIAMIRKESNYHANSVGDSGNSLGLMQIQPRWHQGTMNALGCPDLMDPYQNVTVGISIISGHLRAGKGETYALMAYNMGSYYAKKNFDKGNISSYAKTVLKYKDALTWKE